MVRKRLLRASGQFQSSSTQPDQNESDGSDVENIYDAFELGDLSKEEVKEMNQAAPPGQRLEDVLWNEQARENPAELYRQLHEYHLRVDNAFKETYRVVQTLQKQFKEHALANPPPSTASTSVSKRESNRKRKSTSKPTRSQPPKRKGQSVQATTAKNENIKPNANERTKQKSLKPVGTSQGMTGEPQEDEKQRIKRERRAAAKKKKREKARSRALLGSKADNTIEQNLKEEKEHANFIAAVEKDSAVPVNGEQTDEQRQKADEQVAMIDAQVNGIRDFANAKQVEIYQNGGLEDANKGMKRDLNGLKYEKDYIEEAGKKAKSKRKRRSAGLENDNTVAGARDEHDKPAHRRKDQKKKSGQGFSQPDDPADVTTAAEAKSIHQQTPPVTLPTPPTPPQTPAQISVIKEAPSTRTRSKTKAVTSPAEISTSPSVPKDEPAPSQTPPKTKSTRPSTKSPYFKPPKISQSISKPPVPRPRKNISCIPFPPLSSLHFGLAQERLRHTPFHLLIACVFLTKTRGAVSMPWFYRLITAYPTPPSLAEATHEDILPFFEQLGLQNQRAKRVREMARVWCEGPPKKGERWRKVGYPRKGDGRDVKPNEMLADSDDRVGWEVAHLPGVGAYGLDSWRIFCRDDLRDVAGDGVKGQVVEEEWKRVLPLDKELRAYLRWRWLKEEWVWDPETGQRRKASKEEMEEAGKGGVMVEGEHTGKFDNDKTGNDDGEIGKVEEETRG